MKTFILAALVALSFVLGGCATTGGDLAETANSAYPVGDAQFE